MEQIAGTSTITDSTDAILTTGGAQHNVMAWNYVRITAGGIVTQVPAGAVYGGIIVQAVGTTTTLTVYDDTSAVAASLITPVTNTTTTNIAGAAIGPIGSSVSALTEIPSLDRGIVLQRGLFITVGGTGAPTFLVLFR